MHYGSIHSIKNFQITNSSGQDFAQIWLQNNHFHSRPIHSPYIFKYLHSLEPENHITFNSSLIFEKHRSTSLLKVSFDSIAYPNIFKKRELFWNILIWNNCFLGKWGKGENISNAVFNGDRPIVQWVGVKRWHHNKRERGAKESSQWFLS